MNRDQLNATMENWMEKQKNKAIVFIENGRAVTDSLMVAGKFEKNHKDVLRDIRTLECSKEFRERNFALTTYMSGQNKELPMFEMSRDGFAFLVMGYTGTEMFCARISRMCLNTLALGYQRKLIKKGDMNMELKPYLPSAKQIEEMERDDFQDWVWKARRVLLKREEQRDPLTHLRKRISEIVANESLSEVQKEARVLSEIERYERIISQPL